MGNRFPTQYSKCPPIFCWALLLIASMSLRAQEPGDLPPIVERDPFDRITLDAANNSAQIDVFPIQSIDRSRRVLEPKSLVIRRLFDPPGIKYSVDGKHIVQIETFPYLLFDEAKRLIGRKQVDEAFAYLLRLKREFPKLAGLNKLTEEFFFQDASSLYRKKRYDEALQSLDEVYRLNPTRASKAIDSVLGKIIKAEYDAKNYESVRNKIAFARRQYRTANKSLATWESRLQQQATTALRDAQSQLAKGDATAAIKALRRARETWPKLSGIEELNRSILNSYPRVRVGVTQAFRPDEFSTDAALFNWATRRVTPLVERELVTLESFTADGGQYGSDVGKLEVAANRRQINLTLRPEYRGELLGLSRSLLDLANPDNPRFSPRWAEYLDSVYVASANKLEVRLTRPTMHPEGLLPRLMQDNFPDGEYARVASADGSVQTFQPSSSSRAEVREIVETLFEDPGDATAALLGGEIDVIERVYSPDLKRLRRASSVRIVPYRLPTIHGLVFNDREPMLRDSTFRRGILYGINRAGFVENDINGNTDVRTGQVLSGFAPIGTSPEDPLGYAYDRDIKPREYNPALATVLLQLALQQRKELADPQESPGAGEGSGDEDGNEKAASGEDSEPVEPVAKLPRLVLAFPDSAIARSACTLFATDLRQLKIDVTLRQLEPGLGRPFDNDWDLLYVETTIEEPVVDLPNLFLGESLLGRHGGLVWQATRQLQEARDPGEARDRLLRIHKLVFDHTPMLPLWQVIEHAAISGHVLGPGGTRGTEPLISLYGDVAEWRLGP